MDAIEKAIAARDKYLEEHPHLIPFQKKLDAELDGVPDKFRLSVVVAKLAAKHMELQAALSELLKIGGK